VLLAGGGSRLRGVRGFLREALRCPVELFDPFANLDVSSLPPADAEQLQAMRHEAVVALGLAVGRLDDTLYSLEILPEAVRKAQRFRQRTVWNIAAAVLVVAVLALQWRHGAAAAEAASSTEVMLRRRIAAAKSTHEEAATLIAANAQQRAIVDHLSAQALAQHGLLRVQRAVVAHLPPQLWIEKIEVAPGGGAMRKRPAIVVEGAGKALNGVEVSRVMLDFKQRLVGDPAMAGLPEPQMTAAQDSAERFKITVELQPEGK
jgi:hypothetical protein